jgi:putative oxidoreductase
MSTSTSPIGRAWWIPRLAAAAILGQTLVFKFSGAPESVHIFQTLGAEPVGRIGSAVVELACVALLLAPLGRRALALGGLLTAGTMGGAVVAHLTRLGVEVQGDGGLLFGLALVTLSCGLAVAWRTRDALPLPGRG